MPNGFLVPENKFRTNYSGVLTIRDRVFTFRLENVGGENVSIDRARISCDSQLSGLLKSVDQDLLRKRISRCDSTEQVVVELEDIVERILGSDEKILPFLPPATYFERVLRDLDQVSWDTVRSIDENTLSEIELNVMDTSGRSHVVNVRLPRSYPDASPECRVHVPGKPNATAPLKWYSKDSTLKDIVLQMKTFLDKYHDLWCELEEIDNACWVLEPEHPNRSHTFRRVVVAKFCSLEMNLNVEFPRRPCEWRFMGSESTLTPLRKKMQEQIGEWNDGISVHSRGFLHFYFIFCFLSLTHTHTNILRLQVRENVQHILGIALPSPKTSQRCDFASECGICYSYRLRKVRKNNENGESSSSSSSSGAASYTPDVSCENKKCGRPFHSKCLAEWLQSIPSVRRSFGTLFGSCPYCSTAIAVSTTVSSIS